MNLSRTPLNGTPFPSVSFSGVTERDEMIVVSIYLTLGSVGLILSSLLSCAILKHKELRKRPNILLLTLLVSDILLLLVHVPRAIIRMDKDRILQDPKTAEVFCFVHIYVGYSFGVINLTSLSQISLDRYLAIAHPYIYVKHMGKKYFLSMMTIPWINGFFLMLPIVSIDGWVTYDDIYIYFCDIRWDRVNKYYIGFIALICIIIPMAILIFSNIIVYRLTKEHLDKQCRFKSISDVYTLGMTNVKRDSKDTTSLSEPRLSLDNIIVTESQLCQMATAGNERKVSSHFNGVNQSSLNLVRIGCESSRDNMDQTTVSKNIGVFQKGAHVDSMYLKRKQIQGVISTYLLALPFAVLWCPYASLEIVKYTNPILLANRAIYYLKIFPIFLIFGDPVIILLTRKEISDSVCKDVKRWLCACLSKR